MIIGLSGYARTGKDTAADVLVDEYGFTRVTLARPMRDAMYALNPIVVDDIRLQELVDQLGWDGAKTAYPEIRRLLQVFGTEVGREQWGENFWVDMALSGVSPTDNVVITDVRFLNEVAAVEAPGGQVWRIERTNYGPVNAHISDNELSGHQFDRYIHNNSSLEDFQESVRYAWEHHA